MAAENSTPRPTLDEIKKWPATVPVEWAARALGVSRAHAYNCVAGGTFPPRTIRPGGRIVVVTESLVNLLQERAAVQPG